MKNLERCFIDTNVLLRRAQTNHEHHTIADGAVAKLLSQNTELFIAPQTIYEFWAVVTRPTTARGGFGWTTMQCDVEIEDLLRVFSLLTTSEAETYREWRRLVSIYNVSGVAAHDARLVAAMKLHGIEEILTFNTKDFARYATENIRVLDPAQIVATS